MSIPLSMWNFQDHIKKTKRKPKIDMSLPSDYNHPRSPMGDIRKFNYHTRMKNGLQKKNQEKQIKEAFHQNSVKITQEEQSPHDNARRLEAIKQAAIKAGRTHYHAGCGRIKKL